MFGNYLKQAGQIAEGWARDLVKSEQELHDYRMAICRQCPLMKMDENFGPICSSSKCYREKDQTIRDYPGDGYICGCGCLLDKKTRVKSAECVLKRW